MKQGIEFFSFDVDFFQDDKVQFVSARFGEKGENIAVKLLCKIYRAGYFIEWNDDTALLFAKSAGDYTPTLVNDVVHELVKRGFFDKSIFNSFGVLTSRGIQTRYFKACERRKEIEINKDYILVDSRKLANINVMSDSRKHFEQKCKHDADILPENVNNLRQSKVKESKVSSSQPKPAKKTTTTTEKKSGIFDASAFLPKADQIEDQNPTLQSGAITATPGQINAFLKVIGAFQASETEKMNLSQAIAAGCTPEHLQILLEEKPNITSFKADWVIRELIAVKRKSDKTGKPSEDALTAELEKTYGRI